MKNQALVGKEFGNLADLRASDPVTIAKAARNLKTRRNTGAEDGGLTRQTSKIEVSNENYFNRHFAHTPTAQNGLATLEEVKAD
jgi:hypothetical protein